MTTEEAVKGLFEHWLAIGVLAMTGLVLKDVLADWVNRAFLRDKWNGSERRNGAGEPGTFTLGPENVDRIISAFEEHTHAIRKMGELHQQHFDMAVENRKLLVTEFKNLADTLEEIQRHAKKQHKDS